MVNRVPVGARYGLKDWLVQRATALVMAVCTVVFAVVVTIIAPHSYETWRSIFASGVIKFVALLFFVSLFYHAWIGVRDILMDYVKPDGLRLVLMIATAAVLVGYTGWALGILWRV
jgi:succinate dehydrogenase / fumarate reductase, membrane anchor subunit